MHLVNMPKVRVQKYSKGWVVERQVKTWYGKKYWTHIEGAYFNNTQPRHYKTIESAVHDAQKHFAWDLYHGHAMYTYKVVKSFVCPNGCGQNGDAGSCMQCVGK